jgi:release factor glutamine methyltransferase
MPTVNDVLGLARRRLAAAGVASPALDARLLMQHATGREAACLIADGGQAVGDGALKAFDLLIERRVQREPVSKIVGQKEFYGRAFHVTRAVLDPRPDSESLIALCLDIIDRHGGTSVLDLGTGSGCLLLTLLAERQGLSGTGIDLSDEALVIAGRNARALDLAGRVVLRQGSWFQPVTGRFDLVMANPPYVVSSAIAALQREVRCHDPLQALDGGPDGLEAYRAIAAGAGSHLSRQGHVAVEIGQGQAPAVTSVFALHGLAVAGAQTDLSGGIRAIAFRPV